MDKVKDMTKKVIKIIPEVDVGSKVTDPRRFESSLK